jgi:hypothetical protein
MSHDKPPTNIRFSSFPAISLSISYKNCEKRSPFWQEIEQAKEKNKKIRNKRRKEKKFVTFFCASPSSCGNPKIIYDFILFFF